MGTIAYRNLRNYKYQLEKEYSLIITVCPATDIILPAQEDPFIRLKSNGELTIRAQYAWDGPSGPTIDTKNFMRGSLIHDALYQLIRERILEPQYRKHADNILRTICKEDGMSRFRAWYVWLFVRLFGWFSIQPKKEECNQIVIAP